jgi:hypothetical protein
MSKREQSCACNGIYAQVDVYYVAEQRSADYLRLTIGAEVLGISLCLKGAMAGVKRFTSSRA